MNLSLLLRNVSNKRYGKSVIITELDYFPTNGTTVIPDTNFYHKGGLLRESSLNKSNFNIYNHQYLISKSGVIQESIANVQYGLKDSRGGVIVFSTDVNALKPSNNKIYYWFSNKIKTVKSRLFKDSKLTTVFNKFNSDNSESNSKKITDFIGAFSIGKFFKGRYVSKNGEVYNEKSTSIEINGISTDALIYFAEEIAIEFQQETVLVKDLNKNKLYLVDQNKVGNYNTDIINVKS